MTTEQHITHAVLASALATTVVLVLWPAAIPVLPAVAIAIVVVAGELVAVGSIGRPRFPAAADVTPPPTPNEPAPIADDSPEQRRTTGLTIDEGVETADVTPWLVEARASATIHAADPDPPQDPPILVEYLPVLNRPERQCPDCGSFTLRHKPPDYFDCLTCRAHWPWGPAQPWPTTSALPETTPITSKKES